LGFRGDRKNDELFMKLLDRLRRVYRCLRQLHLAVDNDYGAGLARYLTSVGIAVAEVERPKRRYLRRNGKSDPLDAEAAARAVLAGQTAGASKSADGRGETMRALRTARRSAVKARQPTSFRPS
jgi:transposase